MHPPGLVRTFHSLVVPLLFSGLNTARRELLSSHCVCLDPLQTPSLHHYLSFPPTREACKAKGSPRYITDYTKERKGRKKASRKSSISHSANRNACVPNISSAQLEPPFEMRRGRGRTWLHCQGLHTHPLPALTSPARYLSPCCVGESSAKQNLIAPKWQVPTKNTQNIKCKADLGRNVQVMPM